MVILSLKFMWELYVSFSEVFKKSMKKSKYIKYIHKTLPVSKSNCLSPVLKSLWADTWENVKANLEISKLWVPPYLSSHREGKKNQH